MNDQYYPETARLSHIEHTQGIVAAKEFASRTIKIYRTCVLQSRKRGHLKPHFASFPEYRSKFIKSYLAFKRYIKNN